MHDYSYTPRLNFKKLAWENTIYLGVELEVENSDDDTTRSQKVKKLNEYLKTKKIDGLVYLKDDGSLHDGVEICFHPHTLQAFHNFPMHDLLKYIKDIGFRSHDTDTCGLHVHISKDTLGSKAIVRGKWFFWRCAYYLKKFSRRQSFSYCKFDTDRPSLENGQEQPNGRYSALNTVTHSHDTIEVRIFRGTLIHETFLANLQFCDAFAEYMKKISLAHLVWQPNAKIWHDFIDWAKMQNRYQQFTKYILTKGII